MMALSPTTARLDGVAGQGSAFAICHVCARYMCSDTVPCKACGTLLVQGASCTGCVLQEPDSGRHHTCGMQHNNNTAANSQESTAVCTRAGCPVCGGTP